MQGIGGEHLAVDPLQLRLVQGGQGLVHLGAPLAPLPCGRFVVDRRHRHLRRMAAGQQLAHLAHRDAALDPGEDAAYRLDIRH
ncbi:hypothetical protein D3C84_1197390 [compost metagenome]